MRCPWLTTAILLTASLPACGLYQVAADLSAGIQAAPKSVRQVRVTEWTGERFELTSVTSVNSHGGYLRGITAEGDTAVVARAQVRLIEMRKDDPAAVTVMAFCAAAEMSNGTDRDGWGPLFKASLDACVLEGVTYSYY